MDKFRKFISNYMNLQDDDWNIICEDLEKKTYKKKELILEQGSICRYFYFLEVGLLRFFTINDGNEITKSFVTSPYCFTSRLSFRKQEKSHETIQALEDSIVWRMSYTHFLKLESINSWNIFMRKLLNEIQEYVDSFLMEGRTQPAEQRYLSLIQKHPPHIIQKIPLKYLSSYMGIAPQSLSRIREKVLDV